MFLFFVFFFFFKQKTAYEMRISDWSSDVCSSDLATPNPLDQVTYTAVDSNGTPTMADLTITITDGGPVVGAPEAKTVDEDDLPNGSDASPEAASVTGGLDVDWGADDGEGAGGRSLEFSQDQPGLDGLVSNGQPVTIVADGNTLTGKVGGTTIFGVTLNPDGSGSYTFTQYGPLDHPEGDGENTLPLDFQFKAIDADGSESSAPGSFTVTVTDDVPVADRKSTRLNSSH